MAGIRMAVIMAGGVGERFWPLSRRARPKQLLRLTSPTQSLLGEAVARLRPLISAEHIFILTGRHLVPAIRDAGLGIPAANVVGEPCKRNTAGCLVYAAATALAVSGRDAADLTMAVVTADHQIGEHDRFRTTLAAALDAAERDAALVTVGIRPGRPATGYGYIEMPAGAEPTPGSSAESPVYPVARFLEKPDPATAEQFMTDGRHLWNSGMFFWRVSSFIAELEHASPAHAAAVETVRRALAAGDQTSADRAFAALPDISIDYALMEHARRILVVPGVFPWEDLGAWDGLDRTFDHDANGNIAIGDPVLVDSRNCIVYNEPGAPRMAVGVVGLADLVVVTTADAVVVVPKHRAQDVRAVVAELQRRGASQV